MFTDGDTSRVTLEVMGECSCTCRKKFITFHMKYCFLCDFVRSKCKTSWSSVGCVRPLLVKCSFWSEGSCRSLSGPHQVCFVHEAGHCVV